MSLTRDKQRGLTDKVGNILSLKFTFSSILSIIQIHTGMGFTDGSPLYQRISWRSASSEHPTYSLQYYSDDSNGNKCKKWNKFDNWALLLAGT